MSGTRSKSESSSQAFSMKKKQKKQSLNQRKVSIKRKKQKRHRLSHEKKKKYRKQRKLKRKVKQLLIELMITFFIFFVLLIPVQQFIIAFPKVEGYSMIPMLADGDRLLVNRLSQIKRFKLIYFEDKVSKVGAIRRVIGLPGDRIKYKDEQLWINEQEVSERFLENSIHKMSDSGMFFTEDFTLEQVTGAMVVPKGKYFVLGDNRPFSFDSREYGFVDKEQIVGVAKFRLFPIHELAQF